MTGASRGIGSAIACRLARAGARVGVNYNSSREAASLVVEDIVNNGGEALLVEGDVSQESFAEAAVKQVVEQWQRIDILVNNAGINRDRLLLRMSSSDWDQVLDVNLRGAFLCTKFVYAPLDQAAQGPGGQHFFGSWAKWQPGPGQLCCRQGRADRVHQSRGPGSRPLEALRSMLWRPASSPLRWRRRCPRRNASKSWTGYPWAG